MYIHTVNYNLDTKVLKSTKDFPSALALAIAHTLEDNDQYTKISYSSGANLYVVTKKDNPPVTVPHLDGSLPLAALRKLSVGYNAALDWTAGGWAIEEPVLYDLAAHYERLLVRQTAKCFRWAQVLQNKLTISPVLHSEIWYCK